MAELVDALVSNTSGFTSMPVRSRLWVLKRERRKVFLAFFIVNKTSIEHSPIMVKTKNTLVSKQYIVPFILVTSLFFLWGFAHAILDVLNKHFQEAMQITRTHSAMVQVMFYLGYFVIYNPAGIAITK